MLVHLWVVFHHKLSCMHLHFILNLSMYTINWRFLEGEYTVRWNSHTEWAFCNVTENRSVAKVRWGEVVYTISSWTWLAFHFPQRTFSSWNSLMFDIPWSPWHMNIRNMYMHWDYTQLALQDMLTGATVTCWVTNYFLIGLKVCFTRWSPYLALLSGLGTCG